jgi:cell division protein FtsI (penicillin-binding protein 3)
MSREVFSRRFTAFLCLSGLGLFLITLRLYYLQVHQHEPTLSRAERQYTKVVPILPQRGVIWDRRRRVLALSMNADSIFARPAALAEPTAAARLLSKALELPPEDLRRSLTSKREFVWVRRKATPAEMDRVRSLALDGIGSIPEAKRFYPKGPLAGQLLGFVGMDEEGLSGVEHALDLHLRGVPDRRKVLRDALGRTLLPPEPLQSPGARGSDIVLAMDESVQHIAERALAKGVLAAGAASGTAIVMEAETGEVLALAEFPPFDPNQFQTYGPESWRVRSAADAYEPGSTFKVVTAAA